MFCRSCSWIYFFFRLYIILNFTLQSFPWNKKVVAKKSCTITYRDLIPPLQNFCKLNQQYFFLSGFISYSKRRSDILHFLYISLFTMLLLYNITNTKYNQASEKLSISANKSVFFVCSQRPQISVAECFFRAKSSILYLLIYRLWMLIIYLRCWLTKSVRFEKMYYHFHNIKINFGKR
jgi:hypothetical protein